MSSPPALIIGSGVGGLATAIRLAVKGYAVTVFERNPTPGGKLALTEREGFRFDRGPSLFTEPSNIEELFQLAGEPMAPYLRYRSVEFTCRYHFENGKVVESTAGPEAFARALSEATGEDPTHVTDYLKRARNAYEGLGSVFLNHSLHHRSTWLHPRIFRALRRTRPAYLLRSMDSYNRSCFRTPEAVQIFNRFATYNGSDPYRAPAMLSMIPDLELNQGTWYPEGGMYSITEALYRLALAKGVRFRFGTSVDRILRSQGRVIGIQAGGETLSSRLVVCNADVYFVYRDLLQDDRKAAAVRKQERSSSALIFYWGIGKTFPGLRLHNIFFSADYREEFKHLFRATGAYPDPTIYVNITSKMEEGQAPPGKENWFVMVNVPAGMKAADAEAIGRIRHAVITKLERMTGASIAPHIELEDVQTPQGIESETASYLGSLYGTSSNSRMAAFLRHPNYSPDIQGLFFTGGSVHPGGGIPLCLRGAAIVSGMIPDLR
jgi:phytoene desaturase